MALWTPADITAALWLDAADSDTITLSSGNVSQWDDKSGNERHVSQGTSSLQPTYDSVTGAVEYTPSTKVLVGTIPGEVVSNDFVITVAMNYTSQNDELNYVSFIQLATADLGGVFWQDRRVGEQEVEFFTNGGLTGAGENSLLNSELGEMVLVVEKIGSTYSFYRDGNLLGSGTGSSPGLTTDQTMRIGKGTFVTANSIGGGYYEVVVSGGDRQKIEGYLAWKWGLEANLPATHPYSMAAPTNYEFQYDPYLFSAEEIANIPTNLRTADVTATTARLEWDAPL